MPTNSKARLKRLEAAVKVVKEVGDVGAVIIVDIPPNANNEQRNAFYRNAVPDGGSVVLLLPDNGR